MSAGLWLLLLPPFLFSFAARQRKARQALKKHKFKYDQEDQFLHLSE